MDKKNVDLAFNIMHKEKNVNIISGRGKWT